MDFAKLQSILSKELKQTAQNERAIKKRIQDDKKNY